MKIGTFKTSRGECSFSLIPDIFPFLIWEKIYVNMKIFPDDCAAIVAWLSGFTDRVILDEMLQSAALMGV